MSERSSGAIILLAVSEKRTWRVVAQQLRAAMHTVETLKTGAEFANVVLSRPVELVIIDSDFIETLEREQFAAILADVHTRGAKVLLLNEGQLSSKIPGLFQTFGVTNLLAVRGREHNNDILVTINKLLRKDIFGIEKYLAWGTRVVRRTLHSSERKGTLLTELEEFANRTECAPRLASAFVTVADELLANAIYNAPILPNGAPRFRHLERSEKVELPPGEEVRLAYACDQGRFIISVRDHHGSLPVEKLVSYLERWAAGGTREVQTEGTGAGLGLLLVFDLLSTFIVNMAPGQCTECIGMVDIAGSYKESVSRPKSLHIFTGSDPSAH